MCGKLRKLMFGFMVVSLFWLVGRAMAQDYYTWTGAGDTTSWYDPLNWDPNLVPGDWDEVYIFPPPERGPVIENEQVTIGYLYGPRVYEDGNQVMDVQDAELLVNGAWLWSWFDTGTGTVNIGGSSLVIINGAWYAAAEDSLGTAILNIRDEAEIYVSDYVRGSDGVGTLFEINMSGNPHLDVLGTLRGGDYSTSRFVVNISGGHIFCGEFQIGDDGGGELNMSSGTIDVFADMQLGGIRGCGRNITVNMTGGQITVEGTLYAPPDSGGNGVVTMNLNGGTLDCRAFYHAEEPYAMCITEGTFVIGGDVRGDILADIDAGFITAYGGDGTVNVDLVGGDTVVTACAPIAALASDPKPSNGATVYGQEAVLTWSPGEGADRHGVYLGTDFSDVNDATDPCVPPGRGRWDANSYYASDLQFDKVYYWRIDEVAGLTTWKGRVWKFTVREGFVNSLGMPFVRIQPGTFQMGSEYGEWDERPVHRVTISRPFCIQETEVSAEQFRDFDPAYSGLDDATGISWHEAKAFADWLSQKEGLPYRLPTEAEWEYVCRAGTTTPYYSGYSPPPAGIPNAWGVKNMHSSPREWVWDWHGEYPYEEQVDPVGPEQGFARVVRGGGLDNNADYFKRSSNRAGIAPGFAGRRHPIGFRLVVGEFPDTAYQPYRAPFVRQGIRENTGLVLAAPDPNVPYFNQRPLLPIPPDNIDRDDMDKIGLHPSFRDHNHSPGMEVCPNGDVLIIIYTSYDEYEEGVSLMATRLRFGADWWDMPSPMFDFPGANDHAPMLWNDGGTLHFFWGCPNLNGADPYPFQWISSDDSGATWTEVKFPVFEGTIGGHSRQPINTALRVGNTMYVSSDGSGGDSVLWKSDNNGLTWYDPGGRTYGRHTTFALLNDGSILGMGGKNTDYAGTGYMPKSISTNGGQTWQESGTPFSELGSNQRPCITRLASGKLFFCSDFQRTRDCYQPQGITEKGALAALSEDEGQTWHIKKIPTALRHESWWCDGATLGYSVARQAPNGVIHVITTMNHPCQHFEMNEAWILSSAGAELPPDPGTSGTVTEHQEDYPGGAPKANWSAKTCDDGRYLLHGTEAWYYEDGRKQYEVTYYNGRKVGTETYLDPNGIKLWSWDHDGANDTSVWTQYWGNGLKRVESTWHYGGKVARGPAYHWSRCGLGIGAYVFSDGEYTEETDLPDPQTDFRGDLNGDCTVNTHDLSIFSEDWLESSGYINPAEPDHAGLVVHYDFNETAGTTLADSSGNEYTGTFFTGVDQNPADISGRIDPGRLDNSFHFSARIAHAGISMPADVFTENSISQEITVAVWVKNAHPEETPDSGAFMWEFRQWDGVSTQADPRVLAVEASDWGNSYGLWDDSRSIWYEHEWQLHTEWRHYAFVRDADSLTMYVDGLSKAEGYSSGRPMSAPGLLNIGISADRAPGNTSGLHDGFTGNMDDWKIYSYALSQQEILGLAETGPVHAALRSPADLYRDDEEIVNLKDYAVLAEHWLESPLEP